MLASQQCICSETRTSYETLLSDPTAGSLKREGNPLKDLNSGGIIAVTPFYPPFSPQSAPCEIFSNISGYGTRCLPEKKTGHQLKVSFLVMY